VLSRAFAGPTMPTRIAVAPTTVLPFAVATKRLFPMFFLHGFSLAKSLDPSKKII